MLSSLAPASHRAFSPSPPSFSFSPFRTSPLCLRTSMVKVLLGALVFLNGLSAAIAAIRGGVSLSRVPLSLPDWLRRWW